MDKKLIDEIELRLKAPIIALERIAEGRHLPQIFADVAMCELKRTFELLSDLKEDS